VPKRRWWSLWANIVASYCFNNNYKAVKSKLDSSAYFHQQLQLSIIPSTLRTGKMIYFQFITTFHEHRWSINFMSWDTRCVYILMNVTAKWLVFIPCIQQVLRLNLRPEISYPGFFHGFPQFLQANTRTVPLIRPWLHPSTSFPIRYSLINLSFNAIYQIYSNKRWCPFTIFNFQENTNFHISRVFMSLIV
jgi:hypothetical protein